MSDSSKNSQAAEETGLRIVSDSSLSLLPNGVAPALEEMIGRSLLHIETSKTMSTLHRIGKHELYEPDYRLVCSWAEELGIDKEDVLFRLMDGAESELMNLRWGESLMKTTIFNGKFKSIFVYGDILDISEFAPINGLDIDRMYLWDCCNIININLSEFINLDELFITSSLKNIDLSKNLNITKLCIGHDMTELNITMLSKLKELGCRGNKLSELNLSGNSSISKINCSDNKLQNINLLDVPFLTELHCGDNDISELDIRKLYQLKNLTYERNNLRLIQRPDQNF
jgi:hypothetical protein